MTACKHSWELYGNHPPGEDRERFWKCVSCGIIGYRCGSRSTRTIKCHVKGCNNLAVNRMWGRDYAGRLKWVCQKHSDSNDLVVTP